MVARPGRGFAFGEIALVTDEPRAATIRATGATTCVVISRQDFQEEALQGEIGTLLQAKMQEYKREAARKKRTADDAVNIPRRRIVPVPTAARAVEF